MLGPSLLRRPAGRARRRPLRAGVPRNGHGMWPGRGSPARHGARADVPRCSLQRRPARLSAWFAASGPEAPCHAARCGMRASGIGPDETREKKARSRRVAARLSRPGPVRPQHAVEMQLTPGAPPARALGHLGAEGLVEAEPDTVQFLGVERGGEAARRQAVPSRPGLRRGGRRRRARCSSAQVPRARPFRPSRTRGRPRPDRWRPGPRARGGGRSPDSPSGLPLAFPHHRRGRPPRCRASGPSLALPCPRLRD